MSAWRVEHRAAGQDSPFPGYTQVWPESWTVLGGPSTFGGGTAFASYLTFFREDQATAVRDALNQCGPPTETP